MKKIVRTVFWMCLFMILFSSSSFSTKAAQRLKANEEVTFVKKGNDNSQEAFFEIRVEKEGYQEFKFLYKNGGYPSVNYKLLDEKYNVLVDGGLSQTGSFGKCFFKKGTRLFLVAKISSQYALDKYPITLRYEETEEKRAEKERNDLPQLATSIKDRVIGNNLSLKSKVNHSQTGSKLPGYESETDIDYFKYETKENGLLSIKMELSRNQDFYYTLSFMTLDGTVFWSRYIDKNAPLQYEIPLGKGSYFIKLVNTGKEVTEYTLSLFHKKDSRYELESNHTLEGASNFQKIASIGVYGDIDLFQAKITKTGKYKIGLEFLDIGKDVGQFRHSIYVNGKLGKEYDRGEESDLTLKKGDQVVVKVRYGRDYGDLDVRYKAFLKKVK